jgi:hypothetical protein
MRQDGGRIEHALSILRRTGWDAFTLLLDVWAVAAAIFPAYHISAATYRQLASRGCISQWKAIAGHRRCT